MILPTKHLSPQNSLLGVASKLLAPLGRHPTVTELWLAVRSDKGVGSFERFTLALDLMYAIGVVEFSDGRLHRVD